MRKRPADIIPLLKFFLDHYNHEFGKSVYKIEPGVEKIFKEYTWPGNVRELRNIVERIVLLESGDSINIDALPSDLMIEPMKNSSDELDIDIPERGLPLEEVEYHLLLKALEKTHHNQTRAAKLLDISRDALRYKMKKHGLL